MGVLYHQKRELVTPKGNDFKKKYVDTGLDEQIVY